MKVRHTTAAAVIAAAILAVPSVVWADDVPVTTTVDTPALTQPVTTTDPVAPPAPVSSAPSPVSLPVGGTQVRALLLKRVRVQLTLTVKSARRWQSLLGLKLSPGVNIWSLGSLEAGQRILANWQARSRQLHQKAKRVMRARIVQFTENVEHQRLVMGLKPFVRTLAISGNLEQRYLRARRLAVETFKRFRSPPYAPQLLCIHGGEGSWTANTGNDFYGGLQMNWQFMATYGPWLLRHKGTADHWTPLEQLWVGAKAVPSRGFYPWPNTGRACGLIS